MTRTLCKQTRFYCHNPPCRNNFYFSTILKDIKESPASFGRLEAVYRAAKEDGKFQLSRNKIRTWLRQQTHTLYIDRSVTDLREIGSLSGV